jgi:ribosomal protein S18 acetylase RimI-like enzyme
MKMATSRNTTDIVMPRNDSSPNLRFARELPTKFIECVDIRLLQESDLHAMAPFYDQSAYALRHVTEAPEELELLVAWRDDRPLGWVMLHWGDVAQAPAEWSGRHLQLEQLQVLEEHRNRGIGTALLLAAERAAAHRGREFVSLGVGVDNRDARRLYERLGYRDADLPPVKDGGVFLDRNGNERRWRETWVFMIKALGEAERSEHLY